MKRHFAKSVAAAIGATALVSGCTGVRIIDPPDGQAGNPITSFSVQFHPNFVAGSFRATLDGNDITSLFGPTPVPGGTSVAQWNQPFGTVSSTTIGKEHHLSVDSNVNPQSGFPLDQQRGFADFSAPHLRFYPPQSFNMAHQSTVQTDVCLEPTPSAPVFPVVVSLTPGNAAPVSLNGGPLGGSTSVSLQPSANGTRTCAPVAVTTGTVPGSFVVGASAIGCESGALDGSVRP